MGASVGSFVNVLVSRSMAGRDWVRGRSICDHCGKTLTWYDMIPLLSYVIQRGKSRCCNKSLTIAHPIVEGLFGTLFVWWLMVGFLFFKLAFAPWTIIQPLFWLGIGIILLIIAVADAMYGLIIMPLIYIGVAWIYTYRVMLVIGAGYRIVDLTTAMLSGLLSFGFLQLLRVMTKGKGMGDGDPYLAFLTGSLLSGVYAAWGMLVAFVTGSIVGLALILMKKKKMSQTIAFGPFLIFGAAVVLFVSRFGY